MFEFLTNLPFSLKEWAKIFFHIGRWSLWAITFGRYHPEQLTEDTVFVAIYGFIEFVGILIFITVRFG